MVYIKVTDEYLLNINIYVSLFIVDEDTDNVLEHYYFIYMGDEDDYKLVVANKSHAHIDKVHNYIQDNKLKERLKKSFIQKQI